MADQQPGHHPTDLEHFLGYFVAHEAHHRGQLVLLARQLGHPLPREVTSGLWQWTRLRRKVADGEIEKKPGGRAPSGPTA